MDEYTRQLIYVPVIHSPADMGTMGEELEAACIERLGRRHWEDYLALLDQFWQSVRAGLDRLRLDYGRVDLYQDGLPLCGRELEIVKDASARGSENHRLLLDLMARGATLMGTEDPNLLLAEYRNVQTALASQLSDDASAGRIDQAAECREMLAKRDAYIGRRIGETLQPGRTAILFLGIMHDVESHLPQDIVATRLGPTVARPKNRTRQGPTDKGHIL